MLEVKVVGLFNVPEWLDLSYWDIAVEESEQQQIPLFDCERYYLQDFHLDLSGVSRIQVTVGLYRHFAAGLRQYQDNKVSWYTLCRDLPILGAACITETADSKIITGVRSKVFHDRQMLDIVPAGGLTGEHREGLLVNAVDAIIQEGNEELYLSSIPGHHFGIGKDLRFLGVSYTTSLHGWNPTLMFHLVWPFQSCEILPSKEHSSLVFQEKESFTQCDIPMTARQVLEFL